MSVEDLGAVAVVGCVVAVIILVLGFVVFQIADGFSLTAGFNDTNSQAQFTAMKNTSYKYDWIFFGFFIGLVLSLIITSWFVAGNPIFIVLYFLGIFMFDIVAIIFANIWEGLSSYPVFASYLAHLPITNFIMLRLPIFIAVVGFLGVVVMFAKPRVEGGMV